MTVAPTPPAEPAEVTPAEVPVETAPPPPAEPAEVTPAEVPVETAPPPPAAPAPVHPVEVPVEPAPTPSAAPAAVAPAEVPVRTAPPPPAEPDSGDIARRLASARRRLAELTDAGFGRGEAMARLTRRGKDLLEQYGAGPSAGRAAGRQDRLDEHRIGRHLEERRIGPRLDEHRIGPRLAEHRLGTAAGAGPDRRGRNARNDDAVAPSVRRPAEIAATRPPRAPSIEPPRAAAADFSPLLVEMQRQTVLLGRLARMTGVTG